MKLSPVTIVCSVSSAISVLSMCLAITAIVRANSQSAAVSRLIVVADQHARLINEHEKLRQKQIDATAELYAELKKENAALKRGLEAIANITDENFQIVMKSNRR